MIYTNLQDAIPEPTRCNQILIVTQAHLQLRTSTILYEST